MTEPWLSVIIPTFNGAHYISDTLESIAIQEDPGVEVVIVDDGSTDCTLDVVAQFGHRLHLKIIPSGRIGNWVATTNIGMNSATGQYLCWLHQDDVWEPNRLRELRKIISSNPTIEWLFGPSHFIDLRGRKVGQWNCPFEKHGDILSPGVLRERLCVQNFIATCSPVISASIVRRAGPLDDRLWFLADWDYWLRLSQLSQAYYYPIPSTSFRLHPTSQTVSRAREQEDLKSQFDLVFDRHCRPLGIPALEKLSKFSSELNLALLARGRLAVFSLARLAVKFLRLGPRSWVKFHQSSRLTERIWARVMAGALLWK